MPGVLIGLTRRLARSQRGNVMILSALSIMLLLGMGGGALDLSRIYLVKTRMQQGCDAGVLAFRKSMQGTNVTPTTYSTALAYFNANFSPGRYGSENTLFPAPTVDANVVVHGTASTSVPMSLMRIFGFRQIALTAKCDAQLQLPNTDVMFVLDTTGSMTLTNPGDSTNRITGLRNAVLNFYNTLEQAKIAGTQVRYGFVPYANTVNVGMLLKRDWMVDSWTYQSRQFDRQEKEQTGTEKAESDSYSAWSPSSPTISTSYGDPENCVAPANKTTTTGAREDAWSPSDTAVPRTKVYYRTFGGDTYTASSDSSGQCIITRNNYPTTNQQQTRTISANPKAGQPIYSTKNFFWYRPTSYSVAAFKGTAANGLMAGASNVAMANVNAPSGSNTTGSDQKVSWTASSACIEERKTLRANEAGTAWDMDVDAVPTPGNPDTQWRPALPGLVFARQVSNLNASVPTGWNAAAVNTTSGYPQLSSSAYINRAACSSAARKLQSKEAGLTAAAVKTYLDALVTRGQTYHDIGFLWGLRLISKEGLFSSENTSAPDGSSIARNIIFMTDGDTETRIQDYDAYGLSALDRRRTDQGSLPTNAQQDTIVEDRLQRYCSVAKNQKGITVWVIAFGTNLTPLLRDCASQGRAFQANNSQQLNETFAEIAAKIAQLRLTR